MEQNFNMTIPWIGIVIIPSVGFVISNATKNRQHLLTLSNEGKLTVSEHFNKVGPLQFNNQIGSRVEIRDSNGKFISTGTISLIHALNTVTGKIEDIELITYSGSWTEEAYLNNIQCENSDT